MITERKYLLELVRAVEAHLKEVEHIISHSNGNSKRIEASCNELERVKDLVKRYGLK
jgi:hypothetical protein